MGFEVETAGAGFCPRFFFSFARSYKSAHYKGTAKCQLHWTQRARLRYYGLKATVLRRFVLIYLEGVVMWYVFRCFICSYDHEGKDGGESVSESI